MGIDFKSFFRTTAQARTGAAEPPPTPAQVRARVVAAHAKLADVLDRLETAIYSQDPWGGPSPEVEDLKDEKKAAKKELAGALKAFKKTTGEDYLPPRAAPRGTADDGYSAAGAKSSDGGRRPNGRTGPSAPPPRPSGYPAATEARRAQGAAENRRQDALGEILGRLLLAPTFESREVLLRDVSVAELTAIERDLSGALRRHPELHRSLASTLERQRNFNRALFYVHPDKNRAPAHASEALSDVHPDTHRAKVDAYLAKLDVVRNILNASRQLANDGRFPAAP